MMDQFTPPATLQLLSTAHKTFIRLLFYTKYIYNIVGNIYVLTNYVEIINR